VPFKVAFACILSVSGCFCSHTLDDDPDSGARDAGESDPGLDAGPPIHVTGCGDPMLWRSTALPATGRSEIGGRPCSEAQYPVHVATLSWHPDDGMWPEDLPELTACWRVVEAHPGSGWTIGDIVSGERAALVGFERPVSFEGRVIDARGVLRYRVPAIEVMLDAPVAARADDLVVPLSRGVWLTPTAVERELGESASTEGTFVDGTLFSKFWAATLEQTSDGTLLRAWWVGTDRSDERARLALPGETDAQIVRHTIGVHTDRRLREWVLEDDGLRLVRDTTLPTAPMAVTSDGLRLIARLPGELWVLPREGERSIVVVGDAALLEAPPFHAPHVFDGERFTPLDVDAAALDADASFTLDPSELVIVGRPIAVAHGVVIGSAGFALAGRDRARIGGPRSVSVEDLFGLGSELVAVGADATEYAIRRADGTTEILSAPYNDYCD
jgi:hypothetical protein